MKIVKWVLLMFLLMSIMTISKTATSGQSVGFGKMVEWIAGFWADIQIYATFAGFIAIAWFIVNQTADHESARTWIKVGAVLFGIVAVWVIEPIAKSLGGNTIDIQYLQQIKTISSNILISV